MRNFEAELDALEPRMTGRAVINYDNETITFYPHAMEAVSYVMSVSGCTVEVEGMVDQDLSDILFEWMQEAD